MRDGQRQVPTQTPAGVRRTRMRLWQARVTSLGASALPFLFLARTGENTGHRVISFVTRVLIHRSLRCAHGNPTAPRLRIGRWLFDLELIEDVVLRDTREMLRHLRVR